MKKPQYFLILITCLFLLNSCSEEEDDAPPCSQNENISMKINGEEMQFLIQGWGIDLDRDGTGHTLFLMVVTGEFYPQQDSYSITLILPYKQTGENIIEAIRYFRVQNGTSAEGVFVPGELQSKVTVNTKSCFSATFSGSAVIDGNEIIISEGIIDHVYADPFEDH